MGIDLFVKNRETCLLVSDYYSKFPFVYMIPSPVTSTAVIGKMKSLFAEQGVPQRVISKEWRPLQLQCIQEVHWPVVLRSRDIKPTLPSVKRLYRTPRTKCETHFEESWSLIRRPYDPIVPRATPTDIHLQCSAEPLYGRRVVSNLPVATWNASGKRYEICARLDQRQATAEERHDARGARDLADVSRGEHVRTRHPVTHRWEPDRIVEKCQQPRSYKVESDNGSVLRRNRRDIRETAEKHVFLSTDVERQRNFRETAADDDDHDQASSNLRPTTVEPPTRSLTATPVEPLVTPASVEPVQETVGSPIRKDSVKRVRFPVEQKGYHTRLGRLTKSPHRGYG